MEFSIQHRLEPLVALYDALVAERLARATTVFWVLAVAAATGLLLGLWPGALWAGILGASAMAVALFGVFRDGVRRQVHQQFEVLQLQSMRYRISDEGLHESSDVGECLLRWHAFEPPRDRAGFLLVPRRPAESGRVIALPLDQLGADARLAIEDRITRSAGTRMG